MGDTVENISPARHGQAATPDGGWTLIIHKGSTGLHTQAPDVPWSTYRGILIAARTGDDGTLDSVAGDAWGDWWQHEVINRGLRSAARYQLCRYLPLAIPIP